MGSLEEFDALSRERWLGFQEAEAQGRHVEAPELLYFQPRPLGGVRSSGKYISFLDFKDVQRELKIKDEPLAGIYHCIVMHFARAEPDYYDAIDKSLRYNPRNCASWNKSAYTYKYFLRIASLLPYAVPKPAPEYKIEGVGKRGNQVLRACVDEGYIEDVFGEQEAQKAQQEPAHLI